MLAMPFAALIRSVPCLRPRYCLLDEVPPQLLPPLVGHKRGMDSVMLRRSQALEVFNLVVRLIAVDVVYVVSLRYRAVVAFPYCDMESLALSVFTIRRHIVSGAPVDPIASSIEYRRYAAINIGYFHKHAFLFLSDILYCIILPP